jgi:diamine N-acetyltransferase
MLIITKNGKQVLLRKFIMDDAARLAAYFSNLSVASKSRYGPHPFDKQSITDIYSGPGSYIGYIATEQGSDVFIAYSVIKPGYLEQDHDRLRSYGLTLHTDTDAAFAPSVADAWQSCGVGSSMLRFIFADLGHKGIRRVFLWGGVQAANDKAVNYYLKHGFKTIGQFDHNGNNYDMILEL